MSERYAAAAVTAGVDQELRDHMNATYAVLAQGLVVTAVTAWLAVTTSFVNALVGPEGLTGLGYVFMFAPLAMLLAMAFGGVARTPASARVFYWAFVAMQGPGLALFAMQFTGASIVHAAAAAATVFGAASLYGYTTGRNLEGLGGFMFVGLIGVVVAALINFFLGSPAVSFAVSVIAVVVFTGLTAWETQKLKESYGAHADDGQASMARYVAAIGLYLSVVNIFLAILNLFGDRD